MHNPQNMFARLLLLVLTGCAILLTGCGNPGNLTANANRQTQNGNAEADKNNPAKDKLEELLELVQLPEVPEEVVWREEEVISPTKNQNASKINKLTAVLQYTPETAARVVAVVEKNRTPEQVEIGAENWFPQELSAKSQLAGNGMIKGTAYGANQFLNVPYSTGRIVKIEGTDYFVLELTTQ